MLANYYHYMMLGVSPDATIDDIKKAYRKRAKELHPDLNPSDPKAIQKFQDFQDSYKILRKSKS